MTIPLFNVFQNDLGGPTGLMSSLAGSFHKTDSDQSIWAFVGIHTPVGATLRYSVFMSNTLVKQSGYYGGVANSCHSIGVAIGYPASLYNDHYVKTIDTSWCVVPGHGAYPCPPAAPCVSNTWLVSLSANTNVFFRFDHYIVYPAWGDCWEDITISLSVFPVNTGPIIFEYN